MTGYWNILLNWLPNVSQGVSKFLSFHSHNKFLRFRRFSKSDINHPPNQHFWYNVSTQRWNDIETTLHNIGTTLIQRCFNLALTLVKPILSLIGLVMIVDCVTVIHVQYMNSFYSAIWGSIFLLYINNWTTNEISKNFLTVAHNVKHNVGNNDDLRRSLKCCI